MFYSTPEQMAASREQRLAIARENRERAARIGTLMPQYREAGTHEMMQQVATELENEAAEIEAEARPGGC